MTSYKQFNNFKQSGIESPIRVPTPARILASVISVLSLVDFTNYKTNRPTRDVHWKKKIEMNEKYESQVMPYPNSDISGVRNAIRGPSRPTSERLVSKKTHKVHTHSLLTYSCGIAV